MNKEQEQIIDEVYENYDSKRQKWEIGRVGEIPKLPKEEFINKCKIDSEFSETWGLKIEERELSLEERCDEYIKRHPKETNDGVLNYKWIGDNLCTHEDYNKWNTPTRLITLTYKNETITSYE